MATPGTSSTCDIERLLEANRSLMREIGRQRRIQYFLTVALVAVGVLGSLGMAGASRDGMFDKITAKGIEIVDSKGIKRISLAVGEGDRDAEVRVHTKIGEVEASAAIRSNEHGGSVESFAEREGHQWTCDIMASELGSGLGVFAGNDQPSAWVYAGNDFAESGVKASDSAGAPSANQCRMRIHKKTPTISVVDASGDRQATMSVDAKGRGIVTTALEKDDSPFDARRGRPGSPRK